MSDQSNPIETPPLEGISKGKSLTLFSTRFFQDLVNVEKVF